jgi:hypothetical protein
MCDLTRQLSWAALVNFTIFPEMEICQILPKNLVIWEKLSAESSLEDNQWEDRLQHTTYHLINETNKMVASS